MKSPTVIATEPPLNRVPFLPGIFLDMNPMTAADDHFCSNVMICTLGYEETSVHVVLGVWVRNDWAWTLRKRNLYQELTHCAHHPCSP